MRERHSSLWEAARVLREAGLGDVWKIAESYARAEDRSYYRWWRRAWRAYRAKEAGRAATGPASLIEPRPEPLQTDKEKGSSA